MASFPDWRLENRVGWENFLTLVFPKSPVNMLSSPTKKSPNKRSDDDLLSKIVYTPDYKHL